MESKRTEFKTVGIPVALADEINEMIKSHPEFGFTTSLSGFATTACRDLLSRLRREAYMKSVVGRGYNAPEGSSDMDLPLD